MSAPSAPLLPIEMLVGYQIIGGAAVFEVAVGYHHVAGTPVEHGVLQAYDGSWHDTASGADSGEIVVTTTDFSAGLGTITAFQVLQRNSDGDSAGVAVSLLLTQSLPTANAHVAKAQGVQVTDIAPTTALLKWTAANPSTRATHWLISLTVNGSTSTVEVPWYSGLAGRDSTQLSATLTGLTPGQGYTVKVAGIYHGPSSVTYTSDYSPVVNFTTAGGPLGIDGPAEVILVKGLLPPATTWVCEAGPVIDGGWTLLNGPAHLALTQRAAISGNTIVDLTPTAEPQASGIFDATLLARRDTTPAGEVHKAVRFIVEGGLLLGWLHGDCTLYDLQLDLRGGLDLRQVQSYYGIAAQPAGDRTTTTSGTDSSGFAFTAETVSKIAAVAAAIATLKRGDQPRFAIVIRDGARILDAGVDNVFLTIRAKDMEDDQWVFKIAGVASYGTSFGQNQRYWLVEFTVTDAHMEAIMMTDDLQEVTAEAEITLTYNARIVSSATFPIVFKEDVLRDTATP